MGKTKIRDVTYYYTPLKKNQKGNNINIIFLNIMIFYPVGF